jgi:heat-inducible transcriptional repressor
MANMIDLTERQRRLLAGLIQQYVETAAPVGSEALRRHERAVSSATIRNDLATLEELGYLTHPHTSAGRVPTEKGYRYFVETLMDDLELPLTEQRMISHQFYQVTLDVEQWMRLTAAVLAHSSKSAALVTAPQSTRCRFKHLQLVAINEQVSLLVLVLQEGAIKQQMLAMNPPLTQDNLAAISNRLNDHYGGKSVGQIRTYALTLSTFEEQVVGAVVAMMEQIDQRTTREIYRDGIADILRQPEFAASDRIQALLGVLEGHFLLDNVLTELAPMRGVQVVIGGESHHDELSDYSMVLARFGSEEASGVVGVLGPQRMPYARTIGVVRYVSTLLDDLMGRMFG